MFDATTGLAYRIRCQDNAASTVVVDDIAAANGTLTNAGNTSASATTGPGGLLASAFLLDGTNDCVVGPNVATMNGVNKATFSAWFKCGSLHDFQHIIGRLEDTNYQNFLAVYTGGAALGSTSRIAFGVITSDTACNGYTSSDVIVLNQWQHVVVTFDGTQATNAAKVKIYIDGVAQSLTFDQTMPTTLMNQSKPWYLGWRSDEPANGSWHGSLCDMCLTPGRAYGQSDAYESMFYKDGTRTSVTYTSGTHTLNPAAVQNVRGFISTGTPDSTDYPFAITNDALQNLVQNGIIVRTIADGWEITDGGDNFHFSATDTDGLIADDGFGVGLSDSAPNGAQIGSVTLYYNSLGGFVGGTHINTGIGLGV